MVNIDKDSIIKSKEILNPELFKIGDLLRLDTITEKVTEKNIKNDEEENEGVGDEEIELTEVTSKYGIVTSISEEYILCSEPIHYADNSYNSTPGITNVNYSKADLVNFDNISILNRD